MLDLLSVVTGLGDGGSGERDGVDEEGGWYAGVGEGGRYGGGVSKNPEEDIEPFLDEEREREKRLGAALCLDLKLKFWILIDLYT